MARTARRARVRGARRLQGARIAGVVTACSLVGALAVTLPGSASAENAFEPPAAVMDVAAGAASGAGGVASRAMAATAADRMAALGGVAVTLQFPAAPPPKAASRPVPRGAGISWGGWHSGAAGPEVANGSFGSWAGHSLGIVGVWCDSIEEAQRDLDAVDAYSGFDGDMDVAVGGLVKGETWQQAASGAFVDRWTTAMRNLKAKRQGKGITYVRIAHEMNGDWMPWGINAANLAAYKTGYRLYASIVRKEFPQARLTWSPNGGNHTNVSIDDQYPGDDVVDVVGPDIYDGYPEVTSPSLWQESSSKWLTAANPQGLGAWQTWAARRGKPLALPEWGLPYGDHPEFIRGVHDTLAAHAASRGSGSNAGRFVYDVYFNAEDKFKLYPGPNSSAGSLYKSLTWGN